MLQLNLGYRHAILPHECVCKKSKTHLSSNTNQRPFPRQTAKDIGAPNVRKALCSRCTDQQPVFPLAKRSLSSASGQGFRFLSLLSAAGGATHYKHHTLAPLWLLLSFQRTNQRSLGLDGRHRTRPVVRAGLEYSRR